MKDSHIKNINELFPLSSKIPMREKINCILVGYQEVHKQLTSQIYLNASVTLLVLSGVATLTINFKVYALKPNSIVHISALHIFQINDCSENFKCSCILVSKDFMNEMDPTEMIYVRTKYGIKLFNTPLIVLNEQNMILLRDRIIAIDRALDNTNHFYYKQMILSSMIAFFLDLSDIIERHKNKSEFTNHHECITNSFIELLIKNYRKEHNVDFYASHLNITSHYLTLIVKEITGQTVADFIFEILYSDARSLLTQSKLSIQEIASILNFSDQSAFGKFFKRKSGISPITYRKNLL